MSFFIAILIAWRGDYRCSDGPRVEIYSNLQNASSITQNVKESRPECLFDDYYYQIIVKDFKVTLMKVLPHPEPRTIDARKVEE